MYACVEGKKKHRMQDPFTDKVTVMVEEKSSLLYEENENKSIEERMNDKRQHFERITLFVYYLFEKKREQEWAFFVVVYVSWYCIRNAYHIHMTCRIFLSVSFIHSQFDLLNTHTEGKKKMAELQKKKKKNLEPSGTCVKHMCLSLFWRNVWQIEREKEAQSIYRKSDVEKWHSIGGSFRWWKEEHKMAKPVNINIANTKVSWINWDIIVLCNGNVPKPHFLSEMCIQKARHCFRMTVSSVACWYWSSS